MGGGIKDSPRVFWALTTAYMVVLFPEEVICWGGRQSTEYETC